MKKHQNPVKTKGIQQQYERQIKAIAMHVGNIIKHADWSQPKPYDVVDRILRGYSEQLTPWAMHAASEMIAATDRRVYQSWVAYSKEMSRQIEIEFKSTRTGAVAEALLREQVELIKSIPLEAAERINDLTLKAIQGGIRPQQLVSDILETSNIAKNRAVLIARTETAKTAATFTQARAEQSGSTHYIWRTAHDTDVRSSHAAMEGKVVEWTQAPSFPDGHSYHAGCFPNCRCWSEVIFTD